MNVPSDGNVFYTWGRAKNYRLGRPSDSPDVIKPEKVPSLASYPVKQAACGGGHTCVVLEDERLFVFGYSQYGQVGLGDRVDVCEPSHVRILDDRQVPYTVVQVACGRYHTLALTSTGEVFSWGGGKNGRLGHGDEKIRTLPTKVMAFQTSVFSIACGYHSSVAITADGVYSWGWGAHGQLGHGDANDRFSPHRIESLTAKVTSIACGDRHGFALTESGQVYGWGSNEFGQLGIGRRGDVYMTCTLLTSLSGLVIRAISSGDRHSAALTSLGLVFTWGCGTDGQCGHGVFKNELRPKALTKIPSRVLDVVCGHNFTMALTENRSVYAWGNNTYGQLGCGKNVPAIAIPTKIALDSPVRGLTCGHFHGALWTVPSEETKADSTETKKELVHGEVLQSLEQLSEYRLSRTTILERLGKLCV